ncbi:RNA polymerase sigma-B factor [Murinocardiopsis flavida]|uniref:RNA polymerase sigma-B factor n=1 Tax=Murinocardiopsis flavida TaxID=645275 RepID=A0A2P8DSE3_9ACTN|nr:SigB/SigF/SigG family RNA polymerase sigma factor [Murinocardiopsis flavida]PSL00139.1 RNA polymerase sigma-B factor [Murinocardiopsis flavida]
MSVIDHRTPRARVDRTRAGEPRDRHSTEELLHNYAALPEGHPRRSVLQDSIVAEFAPWVARQARRYGNRGEPLDDLRQAGMVGLVKAVQGFRPSMERPFVSYATPMVVGEIKRHFRDRTWAVHVPRRLQEKRSELNRFTVEFTQRTGRAPTTTEIAESLHVDEAEAGEVVTAAAAYSTASLDMPVGDADGGDISLGDTMGQDDAEVEGVVDREALKAAMHSLEPRDLRIVLLRFFGNKTQSEIAESVGISQMHVSRLISRALRRLRREMDPEA